MLSSDLPCPREPCALSALLWQLQMLQHSKQNFSDENKAKMATPPPAARHQAPTSVPPPKCKCKQYTSCKRSRLHLNSSRKQGLNIQLHLHKSKTRQELALNLSCQKGVLEPTFYPDVCAAKALLGRISSPHLSHRCFISTSTHQGPPFTRVLFSCNKPNKKKITHMFNMNADK